MPQPMVSVLMPVYNGACFLGEAMDSVIAQTFTDFEFIVVDDGSTDGSAQIVERCEDHRVRLVRNDKNMGLAGARNRALDEAAGRYVAWLDADDRSAPTRLQKQVHRMEADQRIAICGTWVETFGEQDGHLWTYPSEPGVVRSRMLFDDPLATSSVLLRREILEREDLRFDERFPPAEDYELWERISRHGAAVNLGEVLTYYRVHGAHTSERLKVQAEKNIWAIQKRQLDALGLIPSHEERELHMEIGVNWRISGDVVFINRVGDWLTRLYEANRKSRLYPERGFVEVLRERWQLVCDAGVRAGLITPRVYSAVPFVSKGLKGLPQATKLWRARAAALMTGR